MDKNWNKNLQKRLTMFLAPSGAFYQLGRQRSWKQDSSILRKKMLTGTSTSCVSILVPATGPIFEELTILSYFQVLPLLLLLHVFSAKWHKTGCENHNTWV